MNAISSPHQNKFNFLNKFVELLIASFFTTITVLLESLLSYPSPNAESDTVAENAVFSD